MKLAVAVASIPLNLVSGPIDAERQIPSVIWGGGISPQS